MSNLLDDLEQTEIRIRVNPETMQYEVEVGMIKRSVLHSLFKDIVSRIDDGSFFKEPGINVYQDPEDYI